MLEFTRIITLRQTVNFLTHLIAGRFEASEPNIHPKALGLFYSMHINKLLVFFVGAAKHRFNGFVLGIIHHSSLAIVTTAKLVKTWRLVDKYLTEFINK